MIFPEEWESFACIIKLTRQTTREKRIISFRLSVGCMNVSVGRIQETGLCIYIKSWGTQHQIYFGSNGITSEFVKIAPAAILLSHALHNQNHYSGPTKPADVCKLHVLCTSVRLLYVVFFYNVFGFRIKYEQNPLVSFVRIICDVVRILEMNGRQTNTKTEKFVGTQRSCSRYVWQFAFYLHIFCILDAVTQKKKHYNTNSWKMNIEFVCTARLPIQNAGGRHCASVFVVLVALTASFFPFVFFWLNFN